MRGREVDAAEDEGSAFDVAKSAAANVGVGGSLVLGLAGTEGCDEETEE